MAKLPTTKKVVDTYRQVTIFYSALEKLAAKYGTEDKSRCAVAAVVLTQRFLERLKVDRSFMAAFIEAQHIIERDIGVRTAKKQQMERDVVDCIAVEAQLRCKVKLNDALRAVVGRDSDAAVRLKDFRKNMRAGRNIPAQTMFDAMVKHAAFSGLSKQDAMKKALRITSNLRGKKV